MEEFCEELLGGSQLSAISSQNLAPEQVEIAEFQESQGMGKAHRLTLEVYRSTKSFPREEIYGSTSQMRRSSSSIGANIAEGSCRKGDNDFARFLQMAMGSASELEYHILLAHDLGVLKTLD